MNEERVKEIQEFVKDFNKKLKDSFTLYEQKQKKIKLKKLKISQSQVYHHPKTEGDKLPILNNKEKIKKTFKKNLSDYNIFINNDKPIWKPPKGVPDYFEDFKRLENQLDLDNWEKVCKYYYLILNYREE